MPVGTRRARSFLVGLVALCALSATFLLSTAPALAAPGTSSFGSQGTGAGQFESVNGVAVDQASGDVYVPDQYNYRVDKFDAGGGFLFASGWDVNLSSPVVELQTCTTATGCQKGNVGSGAGQFAGEGPQGIAVDDNEPLSDLSAGDVYVEDWEGFRVEKFNAEGKFLSTFGTQGSGNGQFEWAYRAHGVLAVGPGGAVYVGDKARIQVFEPSGKWRENISLAGLSAIGQVTALAVDTNGHIFVKIGDFHNLSNGGADEGAVPGVREFEPDGVETPVRFDEGSESVEALSLDAAGDLFVADATGGFHVLKYSPAGVELDSFARNTAASTSGIAFSDALGKEQLYVASSESDVVILAVPPAGPLVESESVTPSSRGAATFAGSVNPEGNATSYRFEYVDEAHFQAEGFAGALSTPETSVGSGFEEQHAEAGLPVKTLTPGVIYDWRVVATDSKGHTSYGESQSFDEVPAAYVEGPWAANVASTSATLAAKIDPLSSATSYRLEWGLTTSYGHVLSGSVGEGSGFIPISYHLQSLEPSRTYHFRLVTTSDAGTLESADHTFSTQAAGEQAALPDGRAWELVSPADKGGALIQPLPGVSSYMTLRAAADGSAIVYAASEAIGEGAVGKTNETAVFSSRGPGGWRSRDITRPVELPPEGTNQVPSWAEGGTGFAFFSEDLSLGTVEQAERNVRPLSPQATEQTPYLRSTACEPPSKECYTPLVWPGDVPSGVLWGVNAKYPGSETKTSYHASNAAPLVLGATPDLSHVVFTDPFALTPDATSEIYIGSGVTHFPPNLYEWFDGHLQLASILPDGTSAQAARKGEVGVFLGSATEIGAEVTSHAISTDGRWIVWSLGEEALSDFSNELFVRDMSAHRTIKVGGGAGANFQTMSDDGSRVFYREHGELYALETATGIVADLTAAHAAGEASASVQNGILGASETACGAGASGECNVYFVAKGVLSGANAEGHAPTAGEDNLYVSRATATGWEAAFVATLSPDDEHTWFENATAEFVDPGCGCGGNESAYVSSRVSPDGRFVTFMSDRPLTGYDNTDVATGHAAEEVYLYDAVAKHLVCASCNSTGARPLAVHDGVFRERLVDPNGAWDTDAEHREHWLAGIIPSWQLTQGGPVATAGYQSRFLLDDGRLFFDSPDELTPQATNGVMNVFEYEPVGVGDCTAESKTYHASMYGCVSLISAGTSSSESAFYDASESGNDVFFITTAQLSVADHDDAYDVYDARVCTVEAPCPAAPVSPPACTSGDSCKGAPSPQPAIFGAPASATFSGAGNVVVAQKGASKPAVCTKGFVKQRKKCVRERKPKKKSKTKRTRNHRRAKR